MTPDNAAGAEPRGPDQLHRLLRDKREVFLRFVRWRATARHGARRDPEDILQSALAVACERWADFERSKMALEAWFYQIVLNALLDDHRYQSRQRRDCRAETGWPDRSSVQGALGLHGADTSPSEAFGRREVRERIERVLGELTAEHQQLVVLIHYAELSREQAAELLGIAGNAARQRYARARARFREVWKATYGEGELG